MSALEARFHEVWRFLTVGVLSTAIEFALFNAMVFALAFGPVTAKVIATAAAMVNAYLGNRHWSFRHRPRARLSSQAFLFLVVNGIGIAMGAAFVAGANRIFDAESFVALNLVNVAAVLSVLVFRFWAYHRWVFPSDGQLLTGRRAKGIPSQAVPVGPARSVVPVGAAVSPVGNLPAGLVGAPQ
jgi:putative flippase GtrA